MRSKIFFCDLKSQTSFNFQIKKWNKLNFYQYTYTWLYNIWMQKHVRSFDLFMCNTELLALYLICSSDIQFWFTIPNSFIVKLCQHLNWKMKLKNLQLKLWPCPFNNSKKDSNQIDGKHWSFITTCYSYSNKANGL